MSGFSNVGDESSGKQSWLDRQLEKYIFPRIEKFFDNNEDFMKRFDEKYESATSNKKFKKASSVWGRVSHVMHIIGRILTVLFLANGFISHNWIVIGLGLVVLSMDKHTDFKEKQIPVNWLSFIDLAGLSILFAGFWFQDGFLALMGLGTWITGLLHLKAIAKK